MIETREVKIRDIDTWIYPFPMKLTRNSPNVRELRLFNESRTYL